jgi:UDP-N-acetylmuramoyl-L-alanyl-D-glutamate--2,6-diaminopimelate ligase
MSLSRLAASVPRARRVGPGDPEIARVVSDSRQARPGDLFVAIAGTAADGHAFVTEAVRAGAAAVAVERAEAVPAGVAALVVPDGREAAGRLAHAVAGDPTRRLTVCGVTGTKGKTTTTYLTRSILQAARRKVGLLGTISYQWGEKEIDAPNTTPGPADLAAYFAEMAAEGIDAAVMEVSSHALDQRRTVGVNFRAAAFTNLKPEHLDYHHDMTAYREAKSLLFRGLDRDATAVLNADDEAAQYLARGTAARVLFFAIDRAADIRATEVETLPTGTTFRLEMCGHERRVQLRLVGRHNVYNSMAAAGLALGLGVETDVVVAGLEALAGVPGRLQTVECGQAFGVLVDYAHTDDALENALAAARMFTQKRLIVVFGCGGDRDRTKRPRMAAVAERLADAVIVTSDNPRTEQPEAIADEIFTGFKKPGAVIRELDRAAAIGRALAVAEAGDVVLIAGKGHESYQIVGTERRHFDDREEARKALAARGYK